MKVFLFVVRGPFNQDVCDHQSPVAARFSPTLIVSLPHLSLHIGQPLNEVKESRKQCAAYKAKHSNVCEIRGNPAKGTSRRNVSDEVFLVECPPLSGLYDER